MPWPIPTARAIAERIAASLEGAILRLKPSLDPLAVSRSVRSAEGNLAQVGRAVSGEVREVHDHLAWWGRQYFPDTAEDELAERHAGIWGVARRPATRALGSVLVEGDAGTVLAAGLDLSASAGLLFSTTAGGTIPNSGSILLPVRAAEAGPAGNLAMGIRLQTVSPVPGVSRVTVAGADLAGGAAVESNVALTARTLQRIRQREHGGAAFDYPAWLAEAFPVRAVRVIPEWIGRGSVGVVVAMADGDGARAPTAAEIETMRVHLGRFGVAEGVRPVTARVVVVPAVLRTIALTVRLRPDTLAVRAAVTEAFARFVATIGDAEDPVNAGPIGARIEPSRISEAISSGAGEYAHDLLLPAAPFTLERTEYPVAGVITWAPAP